jgi:hypothetical protein
VRIVGFIFLGFVGLLVVGGLLPKTTAAPKAGAAEATRFCGQSWENRKFQLVFLVNANPQLRSLHPDDRLSFARRFGLEQYGCAF